MHAASSLVRALAGLDVYLRYWAQPGDLRIIDEPEMNAHPEAQLRITELLAHLVNKGVRIVLTTHSPYVLDHLGTLVEASRLGGDARGRIVEKLRLESPEALLGPEQLAEPNVVQPNVGRVVAPWLCAVNACERPSPSWAERGQR